MKIKFEHQSLYTGWRGYFKEYLSFKIRNDKDKFNFHYRFPEETFQGTVIRILILKNNTKTRMLEIDGTEFSILKLARKIKSKYWQFWERCLCVANENPPEIAKSKVLNMLQVFYISKSLGRE